MKKKRAKIISYLFLGTLALFSIPGCIGANDDTSGLSFGITSTPTIILESTASVTNNKLSEPSPTVTSAPSKTLSPTLSAIDLISYLASVSENNGDCRLPCVWGFDPKIHTIEDLDIFMKHFGDIDVLGEYYIHSYLSGDHAVLSLGIWENDIETDISFSRIGEKEIQYLFLNVVVPKTKQPGYWTINQTSPFHVYYSHYLLPQALSNYGEPSNVFIGPDPEDDTPTRQTPWIPFSIVLFYPDQGFLVNYILPKKLEGDYFRGCLREINELTIITWNPGQRKSISDILAEIPPSSWTWMTESRLKEFYRPIEQIMPIDQFYEIYKNSNYPDCIQVPISLWPYK